MKQLVLFSCICLAVWACGNTSDSSTNSTIASSTAKPVDGEKIFKQYCVTCHGIAGDMGANGAHDLSQSVLSEAERIQVITNGRNTMTAFKTLLNEEKIAAVAKYTLSLKK